MSTIPGLAATRALADKTLPPARVEPGSWDALRACADAPAILLPFPTRFGPLLPVLASAHDALRAGGLLLVSDLVWQTAPTPELIRAFAPASGEKVRPIEGYEMQVEHAGFEIVERVDLPRADWVDAYDGAARAAIDADARGAAKVAAWLLRRIE